jgi:hypothetical protein
LESASVALLSRNCSSSREERSHRAGCGFIEQLYIDDENTTLKRGSRELLGIWRNMTCLGRGSFRRGWSAMRTGCASIASVASSWTISLFQEAKRRIQVDISRLLKVVHKSVC